LIGFLSEKFIGNFGSTIGLSIRITYQSIKAKYFSKVGNSLDIKKIITYLKFFLHTIGICLPCGENDKFV